MELIYILGSIILVETFLIIFLLFSQDKKASELTAEINRLRGVYIEMVENVNSMKRELRKFPGSSVCKAERLRRKRCAQSRQT